MVKHIFLATILACLAVNAVSAKPLTLYEIQEATCQIFVAGQRGSVQGTATCTKETETDYLFLTNAHVVGNSNTVKLYCFSGGYRSKAIQAEVLWRQYRNHTLQDLAVLRVAKTSFGSHKPRVIPLVPRDYKVKPAHTIYSAGCPRGQWPMSWVGHATNTNSWIEFQPAPDSGQSGSALLCLVKDNDEWHTRVCGVVTWTDGSKSTGKGGAVPISAYYAMRDGKSTDVNLNTRIPVVFREIAATYAVNVAPDTEVKRSLCCGSFTTVRQQQVWPFDNGIRPQQPIVPPDRRFLRPNDNAPPVPAPTPESEPFDEAVPDLGGILGNEPTVEPEPKPIVEPEPEVIPAPEPIQIDAKPRTWFGYLREKDYGWLQALGLAGILGIGAAAWRKFLRKKAIVVLDKIEDSFQAKLAEKVGPEIAEEAREIIEIFERMALSAIDELTMSTKQAKKAAVKKQVAKLQKDGLVAGKPTKKRVRKRVAKKRAAKKDTPEETEQ